jgi:hypothetical protein
MTALLLTVSMIANVRVFESEKTETLIVSILRKRVFTMLFVDPQNMTSSKESVFI